MMYLLLRDNKQTGPYTLDELKVKGLKAYDLVWVEGRSAAWRYPSEIDELRAFAPMVEEQPFDRFFKRPGTDRTSASAPAMANEPAISNTTVKRTIYVTMPGGAPREVTRDIPMRETAPPREPTPAREVSSVQEAMPDREVSPVREAVPAGAMTADGGTAPLRESSSMREATPIRNATAIREAPPIRETARVRERVDYGLAQPEYRRVSTEEILPMLPKRRTSRLGQLVLVGFTVVAVLAAGIFIGLSIQKNNSRLDNLSSHGSNGNAVPARYTAQQVPVSNTASSGQPAGGAASLATTSAGASVHDGAAAPGSNPGSTTAPGNVALTGNPRVVQPSGNGIAATSNGEKKRHVRQKTEVPAVAASQTILTDSVAVQQEPTQREAVHRTDPGAVPPTVDKEGLKIALANQVSVGTNKFEVGTFGGIHNLQVTVSNRSAYSLDLVVVQVDYIQANKKTYKSENLYFRGIAPGSALMLEAPRTSRGINIQYKITSIASKELGLSEPGT